MFSIFSKSKQENKKGFLGMNAKEHKKFMSEVLEKASQEQLAIIKKAEEMERAEMEVSKKS